MRPSWTEINTWLLLCGIHSVLYAGKQALDESLSTPVTNNTALYCKDNTTVLIRGLKLKLRTWLGVVGKKKKKSRDKL